ncbi:2-oxoacid:acceptor oxidoreductase subunit alpha [bacterium]|nr:2-oxoacid:acceptor oxidoreductase subunit alpha [bacterium]
MTEKKNINKQTLDQVTIRFAGDSGDGMQLTGSQFTNTSAVLGNDVATFPDFPAEIRAPAGSLPGVSGFQICFSSHDIKTPGDTPDVLVAMNPAALKVHLKDLAKGGLIIANEDAFTEPNLKKAGYANNPLEDDSLSYFRVIQVPISKLNAQALEDVELSNKEVNRSKNFFALGLMYWLYNRPMDTTLDWIESKFSKLPQIVLANSKALKAGYHYGETAELFTTSYEVPKAQLPVGTYRQLTGNQALAQGLVAAIALLNQNRQDKKKAFYASYPITPASDILHELSKHKNFNVMTFQAEDEIAAVGAAIGAAFGGHVAITGTSGPGLALKSEAIGLAVMTELPLVVVNVQRAGPSTGMPTKTEQADLLQAMYGRNGESPCIIVAPGSPGECFDYAIEAVRLAIKYMCPVILLSDGYLANGAEPWAIPAVENLKPIEIDEAVNKADYQPYMRNEDTLARPWVSPGVEGLEHRIGGLEKEHISGNVSYDPQNHEFMTHIRQEKVDRVADSLPKTDIFGEATGDVLVVGWGCTQGAIISAVEELQKIGKKVSSLHVRYINPLPKDLLPIMQGYKTVLVVELNTGQLKKLLRSQYAMDIKGYHKVQGQPLKISEVKQAILEYV